VDALEMALWRRRPAPGLVHHSDRGAQYTSLRFEARLERAGMLRSMGRKGDAYDSALCEAFFATLHREVLSRCRFRTRDEARSVLFAYLEGFYNRRSSRGGGQRIPNLSALSPPQKWGKSNPQAVLRLLGAALEELHEDWMVSLCYSSPGSCTRRRNPLRSPPQPRRSEPVDYEPTGKWPPEYTTARDRMLPRQGPRRPEPPGRAPLWTAANFLFRLEHLARSEPS
jgi:hypothetical protein